MQFHLPGLGCVEWNAVGSLADCYRKNISICYRKSQLQSKWAYFSDAVRQRGQVICHVNNLHSGFLKWIPK